MLFYIWSPTICKRIILSISLYPNLCIFIHTYIYINIHIIYIYKHTYRCIHICICNHQRDFTYNYLLISHTRAILDEVFDDRSIIRMGEIIYSQTVWYTYLAVRVLTAPRGKLFAHLCTSLRPTSRESSYLQWSPATMQKCKVYV